MKERNKLYAFDLLGSGQREGCYASLLANTFCHSRVFKRDFLNVLLPGLGNMQDEWKCLTEFSVFWPPEQKRNTCRHDMLLVHPAGQQLIMLELKVHAGEGMVQKEPQSGVYSSDGYVGELLKELNRKLHLDLPECTNPLYVWMTPDGAAPKAKDRFIARSFSELAPALRKICADAEAPSKLTLLCGELLEFIEERDRPSPPNPMELVRDYLEPRHLLTFYRKFTSLCEALPVPSTRQEACIDITLPNPFYFWWLPGPPNEERYWLGFVLEKIRNTPDFFLELQLYPPDHQKRTPSPEENRFAEACRKEFCDKLRPYSNALGKNGWEIPQKSRYNIAKSTRLSSGQQFQAFVDQVAHLCASITCHLDHLVPSG